MAWIYLAELEDLASRSANGSDQWPIVKATDTLNLCCLVGCTTGESLKLQSGMTCELYAQATCTLNQKLSTADSRARTSRVQEMESAWVASALDFSSTSQGLSKKQTRDSYFSKTSQQLELVASTVSSKHLPSSGMIAGGRLYQPPKLAPRTCGKDGFYWPTPQTQDASGAGSWASVANGHQMHLHHAAKLWPTPKASDSNPGGGQAMLRYNERTGRKTLITEVAKTQIGGQLNPTWVEWLMGYPNEWTALEDWAMQWYRSKRKSRSKDCVA